MNIVVTRSGESYLSRAPLMGSFCAPARPPPQSTPSNKSIRKKISGFEFDFSALLARTYELN